MKCWLLLGPEAEVRFGNDTILQYDSVVTLTATAAQKGAVSPIKSTAINTVAYREPI
jgi:hypothetical protein